nr:squamous cell carcinoma antigen recognized by T-cells 3 [Tanacetum cinerariifolium]
MYITAEPPQSPGSNSDSSSDQTTNPQNYDAHLEYITALSKQGELDKLRLVREAMSQAFPLTPTTWRQWASDEVSLVLSSSGHEGAILAIEKLYERGVSDYMSVSLWCDYLSFIQKYDSSVHECSITGISKARDLFERALIACGLHVTEGSKIWEAYRSYEEAILSKMNETDLESMKIQIQRIRNLFHRQLSIPHGDMRSTLLTYKTWEAEHGNTFDATNSTTDGISPHVASAYQKALDMLNARAEVEQQIVRSDVSDAERLQSFWTYKTLKDCFNRATRNCPWVGELWVRFLLKLERCRGSEKELSDVFERSLQCTFSTVDEYVDIYLTRIDGLRRRFMFAEELDDGLYISLIRDTFQRVYDYLLLQPENTQSLLQLHSYWTRLEVNIGKDIIAARGVWESLLENCASMLEAWQAYISMETEMGNIKEARSLYKRCYTRRFSGTGSEDICNSWIQFEREFGSLEDFDHASQKVTPRLQKLQFIRLQREASSRNYEDAPKKKKGEKRKAASDALPNEESPAKHQKCTTKHKIDNIYSKISVKANNTDTTVTLKDTPHGEDNTKTKDAIPDKSNLYTGECTAFVSNLNLKANSDDLHGFFSDVGGVVAIRIVLDKFTKKSKGLAYVDFSDDTHLEAAVAKNKQILLGRKLSITRSKPKGKRKGSAGHKASTEKGQGEHRGHGKAKLKGRNTFAVPRAVRVLGGSSTSKRTASVTAEGGEEKPKSNEEFRNLLLKKS